jgi:hypothetical protein
LIKARPEGACLDQQLINKSFCPDNLILKGNAGILLHSLSSFLWLLTVLNGMPDVNSQSFQSPATLQIFQHTYMTIVCDVRVLHGSQDIERQAF